MDALLTPREREIVDLIAEGFTNQQIADRLYITPSTVEQHITKALRKAGENVTNRRELVEWWRRQRAWM